MALWLINKTKRLMSKPKETTTYDLSMRDLLTP